MSRDEQLARLITQVQAFMRMLAEQSFAELALTVFEFQFAHNSVYQRYCLAQGKTPANVSGWRDVPAVITSAFKEADWTVLPPADRTTVFYSSGTTAKDRSKHFHSPATLELYEESLLRWFKPFVLPELEQAQFHLLTPPPEQVPHSSLVHMLSSVSKVFGGGTFHGRTGVDGEWLLNPEGLAGDWDPSPVMLCGTAFSFVHLCDWARAQNVRFAFPENSRVFETGGYKGRSRTMAKEELHTIISETCGIPRERIVSEYGMSELSSQAYDRTCGRRDPRRFRFPPWARVSIISPESGLEVQPGETGLIRVYDLANLGSVMAVQTEDLGIQHENGFELVGRATLAEARGCSLMPAS